MRAACAAHAGCSSRLNLPAQFSRRHLHQVPVLRHGAPRDQHALLGQHARERAPPEPSPGNSNICCKARSPRPKKRAPKPGSAQTPFPSHRWPSIWRAKSSARLQGRTVFLVGAGKMSELAARHLVQQGAGAILVTNRTAERARRMAEEFQGAVVPEVIDFDQLMRRPATPTSSSAPPARRIPSSAASTGRPFCTRRRNRPMFFIDIAVPRDVDPEMNKLDGIFVYDIDDLQQVAAAHMEERSRQAIDAEALIAAEVERFHQRQRTVNVAPAIVALQRKAEEIRVRPRCERIHARLGTLTAEQLAAVEALTRGLVNKFLHPPMQAIKQAAREGDFARLDALCEAWSVSAAASVARDQQMQAGSRRRSTDRRLAGGRDSRREAGREASMEARR